jgi:peptidyl-prolyl cis-trans isomerase C
MKRIIQSLVPVLAAFALPALGVTPDQPAATNTAPAAAKQPLKNSDLFGNEVIAKGKGFEIKRGQLDDALVSIKSTAAARGQNIPPEQMTMFEQQVLDRLIQIQVLLAKATDDDKTKGKETSAKRMEAIRTRAGTEDALNRQLKSVGMSQEDLVKNMTDEAIAEAVLERELKVNVTDADVKKFYDDNPSKFEQPEMVRASHILISTKDMSTGVESTDDQKKAKRKQIEDLLKRARAGEDFAKLAKEFSDDPGSKEKGGEYTFPRGQMVPEFEAAAFSLKTNQVSDVVTTQFGYHIIKLNEKIPAKKVDYDKVSSDIKDYLKQQQTQKQLPDYISRLKKEAGTEILDEKLKSKETAAAKDATAPAPAAAK